MRNRYITGGAGLVAALTALLGLNGVGAPARTATAHPSAGFRPAIVAAKDLPPFAQVPKMRVPSYQLCEEANLRCYSPKEVQSMYGVDKLLAKGDEGKGETIVIVDAFGSPTIKTDLRYFDTTYHIAAPPRLEILHPLGAPTYDESNADEADWAAETSLDVEWAHADAPKAKIDLLESKNDDSAFAAFYDLEVYAYNHHLGDVLTQSWGTAEDNLETSAGGRAIINNFEGLYRKLGRAHWSVFASAGDNGSGNLQYDGEPYSHPTVQFPAASPQLTSVGGTSVLATSAGTWEYEVVWDETTNSEGAGGGGVSAYFPKPSFQKVVTGRSKSIMNGKRGVPDVSWDGDPETGVWIRCTASKACSSFAKGHAYYGWQLTGGTSSGSPQWAALTADVDQAVKHAIGPVNPYVYRIGDKPGAWHDITKGNNGYNGVRGMAARVGWDEATGWGTPDALALDLAAAAK